MCVGIAFYLREEIIRPELGTGKMCYDEIELWGQHIDTILGLIDNP